MEPVGPRRPVKQHGHRAQQKSETRERIYQAARKLFAEQGYFDTRAADIARAAGVSTGSVFAHFGSKAKIMTALTIDVFEQRIARLKATKWQSCDCRGRLREIAALLWQLNQEDKAMVRACFSYAWVWDREDEDRFNRFFDDRGDVIRAILSETEDWAAFAKSHDVDFAFRIFQSFHENLVREAAHVPSDQLFSRLMQALDYVFSDARRPGAASSQA